MTKKKLLLNIFGPILSVVVLVGLWQAIVVWGNVAPYIAPKPWDAIKAVTSNWSTLAPLTWWTIKETVYGYLTGALLGAFLGVVLNKIPLMQRVLYPLLILTQAIPIIALAPPLVMILGFGVMPKVVIVAWIVFFPVTVSVLDGLNHVDKDLMTLAKVFGANSLRRFVVLEMPAAITQLFSGLKIGATYAVTGAIIGELAASSGSSLALYQRSASGSLDAAGVYGTTLIMTAIGIIWFLLVVGAEYLATPWQRRSTARQWRRGAKPVLTNN
jgi:NitT/TauT family transport system permease protein